MYGLLQRPAGQAVFEQIGVAVQGRLGEIGLQAILTRPGPRYFNSKFMAVTRHLC